MSKADLMFMELGHEKSEDKIKIMYSGKNDEQFYGIVFNKINKSYHTYFFMYQKGSIPWDCNYAISIELHLAITEKMKELGWIE